MRRLNFLYLLGPLSLSRWENNELRYSLRSVERAFAVEWIGITGPEIPAFLSGITHIHSNPKREKARNLPLQLLAACQDERVPEELILMNDDFIVRDTPVWDWIPTHTGPLVNVEPANSWRRSLNTTAGWLRTSGVVAPISYEGHTPMPFLKSLATPILEEIVQFNSPLQFRSAYGNIIGIGGNKHPNAKRRDPRKWPAESPFWSLKTAVDKDAKKFLQEWLTTPSRWEV